MWTESQSARRQPRRAVRRSAQLSRRRSLAQRSVHPVRNRPRAEVAPDASRAGQPVKKATGRFRNSRQVLASSAMWNDGHVNWLSTTACVGFSVLNRRALTDDSAARSLCVTRSSVQVRSPLPAGDVVDSSLSSLSSPRGRWVQQGGLVGEGG